MGARRRGIVLVVGLVAGLLAGLGGGQPARAAAGSPLGDSGPFVVPVGPNRLVDTRPDGVTVDHIAEHTGPLTQGDTDSFAIIGRGGVPATVDSVAAVVLNVTVTGSSAPSFLTAFPSGTNRPNASNLNFAAGQTIPNLVVVRLGADGAIALFNNTGSVHVVVDILGWMPTASSAVAVAPARLQDTRADGVTVDGVSQATQAIGPGETRELKVTGRGNVPASNVAAVIVNVTAVAPTADSFLTVFPTGNPQPTSSNLNFRPGAVIPSLVVATVGTGGNISIFNHAGTTHVIVDVLAYVPTGTDYRALVPGRLLDTRAGSPTVDGQEAGEGAIGPGLAGARTLPIAGRYGVPATGVAAVLLTVTATEPTQPTFLTVYPTGNNPPNASNLNVVAGQTIPNMVLARLGTNGSVDIFNNTGNIHVVVDIAGWVVAPRATLFATGGDQALDPFACAARTDRRVVCWGDTTHGQAGSLTGFNRMSPNRILTVPFNDTVVDLDAGLRHACIVTNSQLQLNDYSVLCWGGNDDRQLGPATAVADSAAAVTVTGIGSVIGGQVVQVAAGTGHTCVRSQLPAGQTGPNVACWGANDLGQLGANVGTADHPAPVAVVGLPSPAIAIAAGGRSTCALVAAGGVFCWGSNQQGQLAIQQTPTVPVADNDPHPTPTAIAGVGQSSLIGVGGNFVCARQNANAITCWGSNGSGQLGRNSGDPVNQLPAPVTNLGNGTIIDLAVGGSSACARTQDVNTQHIATLCWGQKAWSSDSQIPVFADDANASAVDIQGSFCILRDQRLLCAGRNGQGEDGIGTNVPDNVPSPAGILGLS